VNSAPILAVGETAQAIAIGLQASRSEIDVTAKTTWESSDAAVATVAASGVISAVRRGRAEIVGRYQGVMASFALQVFDPSDVSRFVLGASPLPLLVSESVKLVPQVSVPGFPFLDLDSSRVVFASTNTAVGSIGANGTLTGVGPGEADVSATYLGMTAAVHVIVSPITRDQLTMISYADVGLAVGHEVTISATLSYALVSAPTGELTLETVDQSQKSLGSSRPSRVSAGGLMRIALQEQFTVPTGTTSICTTASLRVPNALPLTSTPAVCLDVRPGP
jgi:hypothetical protein